MAIPTEKRRPVVVSFSGMDGAGKSTQINALATCAKQAGLWVRLIAFWDDVARLTSVRETAGHTLFNGEKGVGTPEKPVERRDKNVRSSFMTAVRLFLYSVDAVSLRQVVQKSRRSDVDLIIFDRYAYDELVNLTLSNPLARAYVRMVMRLVPRPDISYVLDANPVQARARKPEYPLEFLYTCRESYQVLSRLVGGMTIIPPMPVQDVQREVLKHAIERLSIRGISREQIENLSRDLDNSQSRLDGSVVRTAAS
ncbi:MAG: thymidylate kinase [Acidobacteriaceae bacterium]